MDLGNFSFVLNVFTYVFFNRLVLNQIFNKKIYVIAGFFFLFLKKNRRSGPRVFFIKLIFIKHKTQLKDKLVPKFLIFFIRFFFDSWQPPVGRGTRTSSVLSTFFGGSRSLFSISGCSCHVLPELLEVINQLKMRKYFFLDNLNIQIYTSCSSFSSFSSGSSVTDSKPLSIE